jgi:pimeloyl-ACP methyl ester carboxylesterase
MGASLSVESNARMLIVPAAMPGRVMHALTGTDEQLIQKGRIDSHHRIPPGHEGVEIDLWVIRSRLVGQVDDDPAPRKITRGTVVMPHPLMCGKTWFLGAGEKLADLGFDVVLPDLRAHGKSGGHYITWGAKEKRDVLAVMDRLVSDRAVCGRIYAVGSSMGAAVAVQYAAIEPRCLGVMAIAPPKSGREICRRILLLNSPRDFEAALAAACKLADFDIDDASAETAAAQLQCPLLLIHGLWDFIVPYQHSQAIYRAARSPKKLQPQFLHGHAPEFAREAWLVKQFQELVKLGNS